MIDLLGNIQSEQAIILTAPPGWGKTYKLLEGIKQLKRKVIFVFPLRALCDEVFLSAIKFGINSCNCRSLKDFQKLDWKLVDLVVTTPECMDSDFEDTAAVDPVVILDECHLIYYWGETFREKMFECYLSILSTGAPLILLSATLDEPIIDKFKFDLEFNYKSIIHINIGNRVLKNYPGQIFYYPAKFQKLLMGDIYYSHNKGVKLVFCQYRREVHDLAKDLQDRGYKVLSCVGGEAKKFTDDLQITKELDFIVSTSVLGHGVNLPNISKVYFTYPVKNLDFYLQMIGRGGRDGGPFELHTLNHNYFDRVQILKSVPSLLGKSISNKLKSYLYYLYEC